MSEGYGRGEGRSTEIKMGSYGTRACRPPALFIRKNRVGHMVLAARHGGSVPTGFKPCLYPHLSEHGSCGTAGLPRRISPSADLCGRGSPRRAPATFPTAGQAGRATPAGIRCTRTDGRGWRSRARVKIVCGTAALGCAGCSDEGIWATPGPLTPAPSPARGEGKKMPGRCPGLHSPRKRKGTANRAPPFEPRRLATAAGGYFFGCGRSGGGLGTDSALPLSVSSMRF